MAVGAVAVESRRAIDAKRRLQRALRVIDTGMDDAAVVRARLHARMPVSLEETHRGVGLPFGDGAGRRQAGHAPADDEHVNTFHQFRASRNMSLNTPTSSRASMRSGRRRASSEIQIVSSSPAGLPRLSRTRGISFQAG